MSNKGRIQKISIVVEIKNTTRRAVADLQLDAIISLFKLSVITICYMLIISTLALPAFFLNHFRLPAVTINYDLHRFEYNINRLLLPYLE